MLHEAIKIPLRWRIQLFWMWDNNNKQHHAAARRTFNSGRIGLLSRVRVISLYIFTFSKRLRTATPGLIQNIKTIKFPLKGLIPCLLLGSVCWSVGLCCTLYYFYVLSLCFWWWWQLTWVCSYAFIMVIKTQCVYKLRRWLFTWDTAERTQLLSQQ